MTDWLKTIKNVMDAHGAWVFGGAVAAGLVARRAAQKRRSFDADWFSVTCYGCGRSGFSDEMTRVKAPDGRDVYSCVRCQRPDLFMQAEGDDDMVICEGCGELRKVDEDFTIDNAREDTLDDGPVSCDRCWENHYAYVDESSKGAEATNACPHCEGAAGFPREFYYQSDRIDMVPCGTCLTQGRCPGCMEIYPGLTRDNTPEDVFFNTGCTRCGYSESDARAARRTARRWVELVDNPAAAKFMSEYDDLSDSPEDFPELHTKDYIECEGCSNSLSFAEVMNALGWTWDGYCDQCVGKRMDAEDDYHPTHGEICGNCGVANTWPDSGSYFICECGADRDFSSLKARLYQIILAVEDMADNDDPDYDEIYEGWVDTLKEVLNQLEERMAEDYSVDQLANMQFNEIDRLSGFIADRLNHTQESWSELSVDDRKEILNKIKKDEPWMSWSAEDDLEICNVCGDRTHTDTVEIQVCDKHTASDYGLFYPDHWEGDAEDYGIGAVWMAERYDPNTHGAFLPAGSVKRFLSTIPLRTPFFVEFQKSNGDLRSMNAIFTKPFDADGTAAGVLEVFPGGSSKRSSFKRFRVDRVVTLYRI